MSSIIVLKPSILVIKLKNCIVFITLRFEFAEYNRSNVMKFFLHNVEYTRHKVKKLYSIYYSRNLLSTP